MIPIICQKNMAKSASPSLAGKKKKLRLPAAQLEACERFPSDLAPGSSSEKKRGIKKTQRNTYLAIPVDSKVLSLRWEHHQQFPGRYIDLHESFVYIMYVPYLAILCDLFLG